MPKPNERTEHRRQQALRISDSPVLADQFRELTSLIAELTYSDTEREHKKSQITYRVNLAKAHTIFSFACPNEACVGGDFDLSGALATAIDAHQSWTMGELPCQGRCVPPLGANTPCPCVLSYRLALEFGPVEAASPADPENTWD